MIEDIAEKKNTSQNLNTNQQLILIYVLFPKAFLITEAKDEKFKKQNKKSIEMIQFLKKVIRKIIKPTIFKILKQ